MTVKVFIQPFEADPPASFLAYFLVIFEKKNNVSAYEA